MGAVFDNDDVVFYNDDVFDDDNDDVVFDNDDVVFDDDNDDAVFDNDDVVFDNDDVVFDDDNDDVVFDNDDVFFDDDDAVFGDYNDDAVCSKKTRRCSLLQINVIETALRGQWPTAAAASPRFALRAKSAPSTRASGVHKPRLFSVPAVHQIVAS